MNDNLVIAVYVAISTATAWYVYRWMQWGNEKKRILLIEELLLGETAANDTKKLQVSMYC